MVYDKMMQCSTAICGPVYVTQLQVVVFNCGTRYYLVGSAVERDSQYVSQSATNGRERCCSHGRCFSTHQFFS
jgi:hypothetical protein